MTTDSCNFRQKDKCPVEGRCHESGVVYQASVRQPDKNLTNTYVGLTDTSFKLRYNQHMLSMRNKNYQHSTRLSDHIWDLKLKNVDFELSWRIISKTNSYSPTSKTCSLCNREIYYIIYKSHMASLNRRNELMSTCRHSRKFKFSQIKK